MKKKRTSNSWRRQNTLQQPEKAVQAFVAQAESTLKERGWEDEAITRALDLCHQDSFIILNFPLQEEQSLPLKPGGSSLPEGYEDHIDHYCFTIPSGQEDCVEIEGKTLRQPAPLSQEITKFPWSIYEITFRAKVKKDGELESLTYTAKKLPKKEWFAIW